MNFLKNNSPVLIGSLAAVALLAGFIYFKNSSSHEVKKIIEHHDTASTKQKINYQQKILHFKRKAQNQKLSDQQILEVLQLITYQTQKRVKNLQKQNISKTNEAKNTNPELFIQNLLNLVKNQETQSQRFIEQQKLQLAFLSEGNLTKQINLEAKINEFLIKNTNQTHLTLAKASIIRKTKYLKNQGVEIIKKINNVCSKWKEIDQNYIPFILNLIVTEEVYSQNPQYIENCVQISWAIKKYGATSLNQELSQWENTLQSLLQRQLSLQLNLK